MQNFGKIKNAFNEILAENISLSTKGNKDIFKSYVKMLKENEMLKTQFLVISNIENKVESDREKATQFVKESIELFSGYDKKKLLESNKQLSSFINNVNPQFLTENVIYTNSDLHENIGKLIFTKRTPNTVDIIVEATASIVDYILNNQPKVVNEAIELPNSMISTIMVEKYNEKYADMTETEKKTVKVILESTDVEKQELYDTTVRECIDLINEKLAEASLETKERLLQVKDKLLNDKKSITEDFIKNISKLIDLKKSLN